MFIAIGKESESGLVSGRYLVYDDVEILSEGGVFSIIWQELPSWLKNVIH